MGEFLKRFVGDQTGATAIEYGLIAALIAVAIIPALLVFNDQFKATYDFLVAKIAINI